MSSSSGRAGGFNKRIVFTDNDHRHAQLIIKLKHVGITQSEFFRSLITAYIAGDDRLESYIDEISTHSKERKSKSQKLRKIGEQAVKDFGLTDGEIENIFDLIEEEHPDL